MEGWKATIGMPSTGREQAGNLSFQLGRQRQVLAWSGPRAKSAPSLTAPRITLDVRPVLPIINVVFNRSGQSSRLCVPIREAFLTFFESEY